MLPYAHALLDLPADDPPRKKPGLALLDAREALEEGDLRLMAFHELEFPTKLFKLKQYLRSSVLFYKWRKAGSRRPANSRARRKGTDAAENASR